MASASNKTVKTGQSVDALIASIADPAKRADAARLLEIFGDVTGWPPKLWGNMVGYGAYHYRYESGREGDFFRTGFAMRSKAISVYIMPGYQDFAEPLSRLGKHKHGKGIADHAGFPQDRCFAVT